MPRSGEASSNTSGAYRQQIRPVLEYGATAMDDIFPVAEDDEAG